MNLVMSGPIDESLMSAVTTLSRPSEVCFIDRHARRLKGVDDTQAIRSRVADLCSNARVDHAYLATETRFADIKLLALDMDSTLINIECIDEMADIVGQKAQVATITEATMRGEIKDFAESLRCRVALLAGADADVMRRVFEERLQLSPGAETLIGAAKANGIYILLVSGGFTYFAERLRRSLKLDDAIANNLEVKDGRLTGRLLGPIVDSAVKADRVRRAMQFVNCNAEEAIVIGDGANDISMMQCVSHSIAYHAKPVVQKASNLSITSALSKQS